MNNGEIKNRAGIAKLFADLGFKTGAEIGVLAGDYAKVLCSTIPGLKYYGIDLWTGINHRNLYKVTGKKLEGYDATLIKKSSMDALNDFADASLDFVYIDANHLFDFVVYDIIEWTKKVKKGGIVSGHDYVAGGKLGIIPAVDGYVQSHSLKLNLTTDQTEPISWWFLKRWNS